MIPGQAKGVEILGLGNDRIRKSGGEGVGGGESRGGGDWLSHVWCTLLIHPSVMCDGVPLSALFGKEE